MPSRTKICQPGQYVCLRRDPIAVGRVKKTSRKGSAFVVFKNGCMAWFNASKLQKLTKDQYDLSESLCAQAKTPEPQSPIDTPPASAADDMDCPGDNSIGAGSEAVDPDLSPAEAKQEDEPAPARTEEEAKELEEATSKWEKFVESPKFEEIKHDVRATIVEESKAQESEAEEFVAMTPENAAAVSAAAREAEEFTRKLEETPASGRVDDRETLLRVLLASYKEEGRECLFFDSSSAGPLAKQGAAQLTAPRKAKGEAKSVLKLESPSGLAGTKGLSNEDAVVELQAAIQSHQSHPALADVRQRLARAYGVEPKRIHITSVHLGTINFGFTVEDCPDYFRNGSIVDNLRGQFHTFKNLKIHPYLVKETFEVTDFDQRGHKSFASEGSTFQVGPPGRQQTYTQPKGWCRYGLQVLGRFDNGDDTWLHPFQHANNWYRAFHGTGARVGKMIVDSAFRAGPHQAHAPHQCANQPGTVGVGIYCSPNPDVAKGYASNKTSTINTTQGTKRYMFMFQCGVDPNVVRISSANSDIWVVPGDKPEAIRPYGLLLKEA